MSDSMPETLLVYGHIKVLEVVDFFLTAPTGELNEVAWRLVQADPDLADDVVARIFEAHPITGRSPEQRQRMRERFLAAMMSDEYAIETTDTNANPVPDVDARPPQRSRISSTAD